MSEFRLSFPACVIAGKNRLTADDIAMLRRFVFPQGVRSSEDALAMLYIHTVSPQKCAEWRPYFVETLTEFIVHFSHPHRSLDETNAAWLRRMVATGGVVNSPLELDLVLHVIAVSADVPDSLTAFALDQLRLALSENAGAYGQRRTCGDEGVTAADMGFVRRVLQHALRRVPLQLSPAEIAVIEQIDAVIKERENHSDWEDFVGALRLRDPQVEALRRRRWLRITDAQLLDEGAAA